MIKNHKILNCTDKTISEDDIYNLMDEWITLGYKKLSETEFVYLYYNLSDRAYVIALYNKKDFEELNSERFYSKLEAIDYLNSL